MPLRLAHTIILILISTIMSGQVIEPHARKFDKRDGLKDDILFNVFADSKGHIWVSGSSGVSRYDGTSFKSFRKEQLTAGMSDVYAFHEDYKGRIWLIGPYALCWIEGNSLYKHPQADTIQKMKLLQNRWIQSMVVDSLDHVWFTLVALAPHTNDNYMFNHIYKLSRDSLMSYNIAEFDNLLKVSPLSSMIFHKGEWLHTGSRKGNGGYYNIKTVRNQLLNDTTFRGPFWGVQPYKKDQFVAVETREIMHFSQDSIFQYIGKPFPADIINFYNDPNGDIWVCTRKGLYRAIGGDFTTFEDHHYYKDNIISGITRDFEGNYWVSTYSEGLLMIPKLEVMRLHWPNEPFKNKIHDLEVFQDNLWFTTREPGIGFIDQKNHLTEVRKFGHRPEIYMQNMNDDFLYVFSQGLENWAVFGRNKFIYLPDTKAYITRLRSITPLRDGRFWLSGFHGFTLAALNQKDYLLSSPYDLKYRSDIRKVIPISEVAGADSIYFLTNGKIHTYWDSIIQPVTEDRLGYPPEEYYFYNMGIDRDKDIRFFISRSGVIFHWNGKKTRIYPEEINRNDICLGGNFLNDSTFCLEYFDLLEDSYGILLLQLGEDLESYTFKGRLDEQNYLGARPSEAISFNKHIWIPTFSKGVIFYPDTITSFNYTPQPKVFIRQIKLPDTIITYPSKLNLNPGQNQMAIELAGIAYRSEASIYYRYRIRERDTSWNYVEQSIVQFGNFEPGNYTFEAQASTDTTNWPVSTAVLEFRIQPKWTQTQIFQVGVLLLGLVFTVGISYLFVRYLSRQNKIKRQLIEMKYQALQNQMSPHFLFNSLNSILYLIDSNQKSSAMKYLTSFAGLIQNVLGQSTEAFVPLIDEIESIQQYLQLEKVQMGNLLEIDIAVADRLKVQELLVPPMLVQPMAENAVRHGIMPKGSGKVKVKFMNREESLLIVIEDDGIGREASQKLAERRQRKRPRLGIKNTRERIAAINQMYKLDIAMNIEDIIIEEQIAGTRIEIIIPKLKNVPVI